MRLMKEPLINKDDTLYICIDEQAKLIPAVYDADTVIKNTNMLFRTADMHNIPVLVTEQYPKGLGGTDEKVKFPKNYKLFAKEYFSIFGTEDFVNEFNSINKNNIVVFGIETHVCVYYSVVHLLENGYNVYVVADACSSRTKESKDIALKQMANLGANIVTTEMIMFGHIENCKVSCFKDVSKLLKDN
ncbi:isochorismatase family protein [Brachyspira hampsonii]|uniref:Isochorismatase hydrolase n=1 Tax=Brachyspira hampsonii 30446 TaxID=1289135 RepID=A0A2U4FK95_9SPIR|nr:isochorismatase family protein [Brachyspira hampsonii]EKV57741.1 isochorismatase hydrolase [Brachyspira hampsonii 30446]MBW5390797.1 isochorismatase family protein [Brachyspira hampsonii]MBW5394617.1 isochorismatase family protein [Brachyspira hampsonii]OEJ18503.1 hydrolase [Brachyspira hampsonii]PTY41147.1 isochorismatase [Brachyspira hampsonii bv. II]